MIRAAEWMLNKEIRRAGDWRVKNTAGPIGGWAFEFNNAFYPDIDDTEQDGTKFAPIAELTGFIRWHLNDSLSFYFATNWMWIDNVSRPLDNILFNSTGPAPAPQGVVVDAQFHDMRVVGISIGGELILP